MLSAVPSLGLLPRQAACWQPSPKHDMVAARRDSPLSAPPPPEDHYVAPPSSCGPPRFSHTAAREQLRSVEMQLSCPVSLDVFKQPMRVNCGHRFEACVVEQLFQNKSVCPVCRECLASATLDVAGRSAAQAFRRAFPQGIEVALDDAIAAFSPLLPQITAGLQEFVAPQTLDPVAWSLAREHFLAQLVAAAATKLKGDNAGSPCFLLATLAVSSGHMEAGAARYPEYLRRDSFRRDLQKGLEQRLSASIGHAVTIALRHSRSALVGACYQVVATIPLTTMEERALEYYVAKIINQVQSSVRRTNPGTFARKTRHFTTHVSEGGRLTRFPALFKRSEFRQKLQDRLDEALLQATGRRVRSNLVRLRVPTSPLAYQHSMTFYLLA